MRAIHEGDLDRLRALLSGGLRPNPTKPQPITLLALAVSWGRAEAVDLLLEAGADPNLTRPHGVILATWPTGDCDLPILTSLLRHGADANAVGLAEHTPLVQAVRVRCYGAIGLLLDHGAALETRDPDGLTVLAFAARMGDDRAVALLLERGAQLDAKNQVGFTPLALAAHGGHGAVVERLLAASANGSMASGGRSGGDGRHVGLDRTDFLMEVRMEAWRVGGGREATAATSALTEQTFSWKCEWKHGECGEVGRRRPPRRP